MPALQFAVARFGNPGETKGDFGQKRLLRNVWFPAARRLNALLCGFPQLGQVA